MKETVLLSITMSELESLVIGCMTACLKAQNNPKWHGETMSRYVTPSEAAKLANCSRRQIDRAAADGHITRHKIGARTQYLRSEVLALVEPVQAA